MMEQSRTGASCNGSLHFFETSNKSIFFVTLIEMTEFD